VTSCWGDPGKLLRLHPRAHATSHNMLVCAAEKFHKYLRQLSVLCGAWLQHGAQQASLVAQPLFKIRVLFELRLAQHKVIHLLTCD